MSHFSAAEWFEFARDLAPPSKKASMQQHLEGGCNECEQLVATWMEVLEIARRESDFCPPADVVRTAKEALAVRGKWEWLNEWAEFAKLLFDSIREPLPEATRGGTSVARQLLHEAKPFVIDLRLECEPARQSVRVTGQVLNSQEPGAPVADVEVFLLKGEDLLANVPANASGEFDLDIKAQNDLQLFIDVRGRKIVEIVLPALLADSS